MPSTGGGPRVDVSYGGMATLAATMTSAASSLAALAATPPVHAPLAPDEVSTSAAARLSEHGTVLSSRARDGAAVLAAAAQAVAAVSTYSAETDAANAASMAVGAGPAAAVGGPATPAAVKTNAVAADTPIAPMAPRPGEVTAGLIEAGSSSTGATFQTACRAYQGAFEACAVATRNAQGAVADAITGRTGPQLAASLNRFASWADQMASHSETVAQAARDHGGRFDQTQQETPRTQQFTNTRESMTRAQMLMMQTGGLMGADQFARYGQHLQQLDTKATATGVSYHLGELPQAPPPPPPVTDIVQDGSNDAAGGSEQPGERKPGDSDAKQGAGGSSDPTTTGDAGGDPLTDPMADPAADPLAGEQAASPMGGDPLQQMLPMAAMVPSMLAGALGGAMGAVTSVPQQLMGAAQQVMQGAASSLQQEPDLGLDDSPLDDAGLSDFGGGLGSGGGGGGGGGMEPAGLDTSLPPGAGALGAASAPSGGGPALPASSGAVNPAGAAAPAGAGVGGMGMMPPMGGMGAGGAAGGDRAKPPPDKKVVLPSIPNGEPVKGEVERRQTVSVDNAAASKAGPGDQAAPGRPRRRVTMPPDSEGDAK
ncbi:hypothetical protein MMAD_56510 (plasmid) [Mycolicibacterium madagascariense]|uniref:PPE family protein n=1 Tax=Mycolicibacterium madagascariense TaxID=212765 RepID=A0A7I7XQ53_9MYCO|nr:hypothetical protein [Mycolicibacterium madagascariense]BBZ31356.1 hypothetical protein MMAD_56510 [Mycolicibacterium madagascariense]